MKPGSKKVSITFSIATALLFLLQGLLMPAAAGNITYTHEQSASQPGVLEGSINLKGVGPLHMSDGVAAIKQNQIFILSDAADPEGEAELVGTIIDPHIVRMGTTREIAGWVIFTSGYSLPALDYRVEDAVVATDGFGYRGRIIDASSNHLTFQGTSGGAKLIAMENITSINSPRVFAFTIPLPEAQTGAPGSPDVETAAPSLITFAPTYSFDPNAPPLLKLNIKSPDRQLNESNIGKKLLWAGAATAGICACFAIPIIIGAVTPKLLQDTKAAVKLNKDINRRGGIDKVISDGVDKKLTTR